MIDGYREFGRRQLMLFHAFDSAAGVTMLRKGSLRLQRSPDDVGRVCRVILDEPRGELRRDKRRKRLQVAGVPENVCGRSSAPCPSGGAWDGRRETKRLRRSVGNGAALSGAAAAAHATAQADGGDEGRGRHATEGDGRVVSPAFGGDSGSGAAGGEAAARGQGGATEGRHRRGGIHAKRLLRIVWASASACDGSNEQLAGYLKETYAMCNHFGLPQLFLPFSPNDVGSATLSYHGGANGGDIF